MSPTPLKREGSLAAKMADQLRREIMAGQLKPGTKLATERMLSEAYGVSRAIVREALGILKHEGLVISRQGSGGFVSDAPSPSFRLAAVSPGDAEKIQHIVELLIAVRSAAAGFAATRRSAAQMKEIGRWYRRLEEAIRDGMPGIDEDIGFHRAIVAASGNPLFRDMLDFLDGRARPFVETARTNSRQHGLTQQVQAEHRAMMDAIAERDPAKARAASEIHLVNALKRLGLSVKADAMARAMEQLAITSAGNVRVLTRGRRLSS